MEIEKEELLNFKERVSELKDKILTEEATKTALVMPFIKMLGYDIFNPLEVVPEYIADISIKKGEKVDYCIQKDGDPIIIIECKHWREDLNLHNTQLQRYFGCTKAKFAILTNGIKYRFYTDLDELNQMDKDPFLELDIENLKEKTITDLSQFHKNAFNADKINNCAEELKYYNKIKSDFETQLKDPSNEFVRFFASNAYKGKLTSNVIERFSKIVKNAINNKINETINERLKSALNKEKEQQTNSDSQSLEPADIIVFCDEEKGIYTTQEEINAYNIIVDILKNTIDPARVAHRDRKNYMAVLLDDNQLLPICRFWFNSNTKFLGLFDVNKNEEKISIDKIEYIYKFSDKIIETVISYNNKNESVHVEIENNKVGFESEDD